LSLTGAAAARAAAALAGRLSSPPPPPPAKAPATQPPPPDGSSVTPAGYSVAPAAPKPPAADPAPAKATPPRLVHKSAPPEVVAENQRRDREWHAAVDAVEGRLRTLAPLVFTDPPPPLAVGVHGDIAGQLGAEADAAAIGGFLGRWTRRPAYIAAIAAGELRRGLDGTPTAEPTERDRESAAARLAARPADPSGAGAP